MKLIIFIILILVLFVVIYKNKIEFFNSDNLKNSKNKICVITQFYIPPNKERQEEIKYCLLNNINNKYIDEIILFVEKDYNFSNILGKSINLQKLKIIKVQERLSFKTAFEFANKKYLKNQKDTIFVLCNSDIYYDKTILNLNQVDFTKKFLAISRLEVQKNKSNKKKYGGRGSQDVWVWKNKLDIKPKKKFKSYYQDGIKMGIAGCDNYILYLINDSGYKVENKCKLLNCYHLHQNDFREWIKNRKKNNYGKEFFMTLKCT